MVFKLRKSMEQSPQVPTVQQATPPVPVQPVQTQMNQEDSNGPWEVAQTPTGYAYHLKNKKTGEELDTLGALVHIINILENA